MKKKNIVSLPVLAFLLLACGSQVTEESTSESTQDIIEITPCLTYIPKITYPSSYSPVFIYVLVEGTQSYGDLIPQSFSIVSDVLLGLLEPEDRISLSFMEYYDKQLARIFNGQVESVPIPNYRYTALVNPTLAPIQPIATAQGSFGNFVQTTSVKATEVEYNKILTKVTNEHNCLQLEEEKTNLDLFRDWEEKKKNAVESFIDEYKQTVEQVKLDDLPETTNPIRAISQALELLNLFCTPSGIDNCYLVVFSNMAAIIDENNPEVSGLNLDDVNVIVVLQECAFLSDCTNIINKWNDYFLSAQADSVQFIPSGEELELLKKFLVR